MHDDLEMTNTMSGWSYSMSRYCSFRITSSMKGIVTICSNSLDHLSLQTCHCPVSDHLAHRLHINRCKTSSFLCFCIVFACVLPPFPLQTHLMTHVCSQTRKFFPRINAVGTQCSHLNTTSTHLRPSAPTAQVDFACVCWPTSKLAFVQLRSVGTRRVGPMQVTVCSVSFVIIVIRRLNFTLLEDVCQWVHFCLIDVWVFVLFLFKSGVWAIAMWEGPSVKDPWNKISMLRGYRSYRWESGPHDRLWHKGLPFVHKQHFGDDHNIQGVAIRPIWFCRPHGKKYGDALV